MKHEQLSSKKPRVQFELFNDLLAEKSQYTPEETAELRSHLQKTLQRIETDNTPQKAQKLALQLYEYFELHLLAGSTPEDLKKVENFLERFPITPTQKKGQHVSYDDRGRINKESFADPDLTRLWRALEELPEKSLFVFFPPHIGVKKLHTVAELKERIIEIFNEAKRLSDPHRFESMLQNALRFIPIPLIPEVARIAKEIHAQSN